VDDHLDRLRGVVQCARNITSSSDITDAHLEPLSFFSRPRLSLADFWTCSGLKLLWHRMRCASRSLSLRTQGKGWDPDTHRTMRSIIRIEERPAIYFSGLQRQKRLQEIVGTSPRRAFERAPLPSSERSSCENLPGKVAVVICEVSLKPPGFWWSFFWVIMKRLHVQSGEGSRQLDPVLSG